MTYNVLSETLSLYATTLSQKTTLVLHTITSAHINRNFRQRCC